MREPEEITRLQLLASQEATRPYTVDEIAEYVTYHGLEEAMHTAIAQTIKLIPIYDILCLQ